MSVILVFLVVIAGIVTWWLSHQRLMTKPWLEQGMPEDLVGSDRPTMPTSKVGMGVFLAVVGCLFALFASAYFMRMGFSDWRPLPLPRILWFNTCALVLGSVALHYALVAARNDQTEMVRLGLAISGLAGFVFLFGQIMAWRQLHAGGHFLVANPANSFFYLITGLHGLHIVGGLAGVGRTMARAWSTGMRDRIALSVELCAMYWHFLLFIWFAVLLLLTRWPAKFIDICRQLLT